MGWGIVFTMKSEHHQIEKSEETLEITRYIRTFWWVSCLGISCVLRFHFIPSYTEPEFIAPARATNCVPWVSLNILKNITFYLEKWIRNRLTILQLSWLQAKTKKESQEFSKPQKVLFWLCCYQIKTIRICSKL